MKSEVSRYTRHNDKNSKPAAVATQHCYAEKVKCKGTLHRTNDGADRLSERMGRIVVICDRCNTKLSLSTTN